LEAISDIASPKLALAEPIVSDTMVAIDKVDMLEAISDMASPKVALVKRIVFDTVVAIDNFDI